MLNTGKLAGKTLYITGASRGIGKAIALKAAQDGANVVVAAKTAEPHPKLPGTIFTAAKEIEAAGGRALPCVVDVRSEEAVQASIEEAVRTFGGLDIVINNASAINLTNVENLPMKRFDLMHQINARGTYLVSKLAIPYLRASKNNPHILMLSPPLNMRARWFGDHCGYTMAKYGMSMVVLGLSEELKKDRVAVNGLWPRTAISTAAMDMLTGEEGAANCRNTDIMADAAYVILTRDSRNFTGNLTIDEDLLREEGVKDFDQYAIKKGEPLMPDFFLDEFDEGYIGDKSRKVNTGGLTGSSGKNSSPGGGGGGGSGSAASGVAKVFEGMQDHLSEELVGKTNAVFAFDIKGDDSGKYFLDLKNGSGAVGSGAPPSAEPDVTFTLKDKDFHDMFAGKLKPASAFMTGKLKLQGDMGKAMKLEKLMGKMHGKGYHTSAATLSSNGLSGVRYFSSDSTWTYNSAPEIFTKIREVASAEIVQKVNATYLFDVQDAGKYYVDLKNGDGCVLEGEPPETPDATIKINQATLVKMFNRELRAATAFMQGDLRLAGDMQKALALEEVLKAARIKAEEDAQKEEAKKQQGQQQQPTAALQQKANSFHTSATYAYSSAPPAKYESVPEVMDRIKSVANEDIVKQVQSVYVFDVEEAGKYFIDFKNGSGSVGEGDPPNGKPDVTIKMNIANFLKIFNREMSPASAFMTGQIKVSGDLARALTLEKVMKAAREAAEAAAKK